MHKTRTIVSALSFALILSTSASALPEGFNYRVMIDGLDLVSSEVLPDGRVLVVEKHGRIHLVKQDGAKSIALDWESKTWSNYEAGMTQVLADLDFVKNGYLYVQYTKIGAVGGTDHNWVSRFTMKGDVIDPTSEFKILDLGYRGPNYHHGSGLGINPKDGMLYINVGSRRNDANQNQVGWAGDTKRIEGKLARVKVPSGEIPADNPYYATNTGDARAVYSYGLRNPFTMDFHPVTGAHWLADVQDSKTDDEMNEGGKPGVGYGYGGGSQAPMFTTGQTGGGDGAQVGILFYTGNNFPAAYKDKVFVGQVRGWGGNLRVFTPGSKTPQTFGPFNIPNGTATEYNPIDIKMDAAGAIYVSTRFQTENKRWTKGRVIKVWYGDKEPMPPVVDMIWRSRELASARLGWKTLPTGGLRVEARMDGVQQATIETLDGRRVDRATLSGRGSSAQLGTSVKGLHLLVWTSGGLRGAVPVML